jgi:hypothetical protein
MRENPRTSIMRVAPAPWWSGPARSQRRTAMSHPEVISDARLDRRGVLMAGAGVGFFVY